MRDAIEETQMTLADRIAKFEETNRVAYGIIDAETVAREKKTEKLRAMRLASRKKSEDAPNE